MRKFRERARHREALAIQEGADLLDMLMADPIKENADIDGACVVYIRGALEQESCGWGDSYEQILDRFQCALERNPKCVILHINSPGGVVSGLNQCVFDMQRMKAEAGIPVYTYVGELCASAAYAIGGGVADEVYLPPSGIAGSIGVISTMCDQVAADKKEGLNFVTITSGARKADGHPHVAISDDAVAAEKVRVRQLAQQFFDIIDEARCINSKALEAAIFTGKDAVKAGVADDVMGWSEMLSQIGLAHSGDTVSSSETRKRLDSNETGASMNLRALIEKTKASIKAEKNAAKRKALQAKLAGYQATLTDIEAAKKTYKKSTHVEETEEDGPPEEEEGGGGNDTDRDEEDEPSDDKDKDGDEESAEFPDKKEKKAKKASSDDEEESAESDDEEESAESDDDEEKALRAAIGKLPAGQRAAARGALKAIAEKARRADKQANAIAALERAEIGRKKEALISAKLAGGFITKKQAQELRGKRLAFVEPYLSMQKTRLFNRDSELLIPKDENAPGGSAHTFTKQQEEIFAKAAAASKGALTADDMKKMHLAGSHRPNGVMVPKGGY